jgi:peptidyl-prolyl cis-trans isomerase-like 4
MDVVMKINEVLTNGEGVPLQIVRIRHTAVLDDPFEDPPGLQVPPESPSLKPVASDDLRIEADAELDEYKGLNEEEVEEIIAEKKAESSAEVLAQLGDLPDKDVAPPDHVLFVCKLNPATLEEDLELIFSRFGTIHSCEVIRDRKTDESLQYAFIEFSSAKEAENAYFKMDNVLIDDRRIHVDFSQSVAKHGITNFGTFSGTFPAKKRGRLITKGIEKQRGTATKHYDLLIDEHDSATTAGGGERGGERGGGGGGGGSSGGGGRRRGEGGGGGAPGSAPPSRKRSRWDQRDQTAANVSSSSSSSSSSVGAQKVGSRWDQHSEHTTVQHSEKRTETSPRRERDRRGQHRSSRERTSKDHRRRDDRRGEERHRHRHREDRR